MTKLIFLSLNDVKELLDNKDVIRICEETLLAHAAEQITWSDPRKMWLSSPKMKSRFRVKLCSVDSIKSVGFRISASLVQDYNSGPPTRMVILCDPDTGAFRAMIDERWSFAVRTGAGAAVAIKHLHSPNTEEVGIIGVGHMAVGTLHALQGALPKLRRALVTSRRPETRQALATRMSAELGIEVVVVDSPELLLAETDAVVVTTSAKTAFIPERWLRPGCTIYSMGAYQELDDDCYFKTDRFIADDWGQLETMEDIERLIAAGNWSKPGERVDLSQILAGTASGRKRADERIVIRSEGLATMDVAVSQYLYEKAVALNRGQVLAY